MPQIGCPTCAILRHLAADYSDPSIICPECRRGRAAPPGLWQALDARGIPVHQMAAKDDGEFEEDDERPKLPKKRRTAGGGGGARRTSGGGGGGGGMMMGLILGGVGLLLVCCICAPIGIGVAMFFPAMRKTQDAAARINSINNLKQLGLAFHGFHDAHRRLPFNGSDIPNGITKYSAAAKGGDPQSGSWGFQILPYIEQGPAFQTANRSATVMTFLCPGRSRPFLETTNGGGVWTDYFINGYLNEPNQASNPAAMDAKRTMLGVTDGTSNTIFVGHGNILVADYKKSGGVTGSSNIFVGGTVGTQRSGNAGDKNPGGTGVNKDSDVAPGLGRWGGPFDQGALMCMGDGAVRSFPYTTRDFGVFLTPTGGEVSMLPD